MAGPHDPPPPGDAEGALSLDPSAGTVPTIGEIGLNHFAPYLLNRISSAWNASLSAALEPYGMTTTRMRALAVLSIAPGKTLGELAILAVTEPSTLSRTLDALDEQGLVRRVAKADDARVRELYITEKGQALFTEIWPVMFALYGRLVRGLDADELRAFIGTAHKILHGLSRPES